MTAHATPASGRNGIPRPRTGSYSMVTSDTVTSDILSGVRPRPGESDPARMLSGVLMLVIAAIIMTLALVWWLA